MLALAGETAGPNGLTIVGDIHEYHPGGYIG